MTEQTNLATPRDDLLLSIAARKDLGEVQGAVALDLAQGRVFSAVLKGATEFSVENVPSSPAEITLLVEQNATGGFSWLIKSIAWIGSEPTFEKTAHKRYLITLLLVNGEIIGISGQGPQGERGIDGVPFYPWKEIQGLKGWTFDPISKATGSAVEKEKIFLHKIMVTPGETIAKIFCQVETKGETLTANQCRIGIYDPVTAKLLGKSASQHEVWNSTGLKEAVLTAQFENALKLAEARKWVYGAILANGTTPPAFAIQSSQSGQPLTEVGLTSALGFRGALYNVAGQTDLPAELNFENVTSQAAVRWLGLA